MEWFYFMAWSAPAGCIAESASVLDAYLKSGAAFSSSKVTLRIALSG
jgi:hypothetical protein